MTAVPAFRREVRTLFRANFLQGFQGRKFAVTKYGQRFIAISGAEQSSTPLVLVENWTAAMVKR